MGLIERLKNMEQAAIESKKGPFVHDDEQRDTSEFFAFGYALQDAWPKLLAVVEAAEFLLDGWVVGPLKLQLALEALEEGE